MRRRVLLGVEALARYRDDPIRLRMVRAMLARNFSGGRSTIGPEALASGHDQNRRVSNELVTARLAELGESVDMLTRNRQADVLPQPRMLRSRASCLVFARYQSDTPATPSSEL